MCGFFGFWDPEHRVFDSAENAENILRIGNDTLEHRGPDDSGTWTDVSSGVALGHRRLSIIDLSPMGHQPMISENGRYAIAFNGEIYNFKQLRQEIECSGSAPAWRGHSDTEVILAAIQNWGLNKTLPKLNGMFAFALWDKTEKKLTLGRDRLGEKPLYYGKVGASLVFGSELKSLQSFPGFAAKVDPIALQKMMGLGYVPAPLSIYSGIYKMKQAHCLEVALTKQQHIASIEPSEQSCYWDIQTLSKQGVDNPLELSETEHILQLDQKLRDAVKLRMESDVPLGAFLSGGYDSSTVVALMQSQSPQPVRTFSIGFHEEAYNEAQHAAVVAEHLKTDHTELYVTPQDALDVVPLLPTLYDEPFADSSQIPTYLVSKMAKEHVTVTLSGDGGDEIFGGYNRYFWGKAIWDRIHLLPVWMRRMTAASMTSLSPSIWDAFFRAFKAVLPKKTQVSLPGDKMFKLANILASKNSKELYSKLVHQWPEPDLVMHPDLKSEHSLVNSSGRLTNQIDQMMLTDMQTYLADDILVKVDRASMAVSLESRVPLLDHTLIEYAWTIPQNYKVRDGIGKWILKQVLHKYVPKEMMERPKMGFGVPIDAWLRGPLRDWAENLLDETKLNRQGYLNTPWIHQRWQEHLSGERNLQYGLWNILMFQAWLENLEESS